MSAVINVDLKHDRSLVDPQFESYKLSLDSAPCVTKKLAKKALVRTCSEDQYSFIHSQLFSRANLLVMHPTNQDSVFILNDGSIGQIIFESGQLEVVTVWTVPAGRTGNSDDYNMSLTFANDTTAIVGDGTGVLFILDTGDPNPKGKPWTLIFHDEICGKNRPFVVLSASFAEEGEKLSCLLNYVEEKSLVEGLDTENLPESVNFINVVEWLIFSRAASSGWTLDRVRRFAFFGGIEYLQLDPSASYILCSTDKPFKLLFDSSGACVDDDVLVEPEDDKVSDLPTPPPFLYYQNVEDIILWLDLPEDVGKRDIKVTLKPRELEVSLRGEKKVGGATWNVLDSDSLSWTISKGRLEINLSKANEGLIWQRFLLEPQPDGEEINDPGAVDEIMTQFQQQQTSKIKEDSPLPAYNAQELEDCDALPNANFAFYTIDSVSGRAAHKTDLSGHQWLFNVASLNPNGLCLRHDVDGFVWLPKIEANDNFKLEHISTFSALGYVQASKTQRKFTAAAPSLSYAVLADLSRRVYVYRQPSAIASEFDLRNRKSGQRLKQVAKQQVFTLGDNEEILGIVAADKHLLVLAGDMIYCFNMQ